MNLSWDSILTPEFGLLILAVIAAVCLFIYEWRDKGSTSLGKVFLGVFLLCAIGSAWFSYRASMSSNDEMKEHFEVLLADLDLARQSLDTANFIVRQQDRLSLELSRARDTISALQAEKTAEILGGTTPPTLIVTTQLYEVANFPNMLGEHVDTIIYFVDFRFEVKNESRYFLKSVLVTLDGLDYNKIMVANAPLKNGLPLMIDLLNADRQTSVPFNTIAPGKSKSFTERIAFGHRRLYQFEVDVEWTNGEYIADVQVESYGGLDAKEMTIENFRNKKFGFRLDKIDFHLQPGGQKPKVKFVHDNRLNFDVNVREK